MMDYHTFTGKCDGMCDNCDCPPAREVPKGSHDFDDDGCCVKCGFDGAEWHWWKRHTYEGKAHPEARMPLCNDA